jgi:hypothetical protein
LPDPSADAQRQLAQRLLNAIKNLAASLNNNDNKDKCECKAATPNNIKMVVADSPMFSVQQSVSAPGVQEYVNAIQAGLDVEPSYVDGNLIIDGNHRYIAWLLCDKAPRVKPWQPPLTAKRYPLPDIQVDPSSWRR